ncbi:MAG TPA: Calx-beta domain-containing protein [Pyrinomonadaceae bacterium]|nr:Calx-beta domain-containing protein [Pyrinomonadaceae bacterium]
MLRLRPLIALVCLALALCLLGLWSGGAQTGGLRRVTNTTEEGINVNPSLSGDGRRIGFESTEDLAAAGGGDRFRAIRADLASDPATFLQLGAARSPAPGISQDGSVIAFAARENPLGTNPDGNSEIFLYSGATLRQITNTTPNDISTRVRDGNFQPSLSDDGRFIAFSSNRNLSGQNGDGNLEIFIFDAAANAFTQLTNTTGAVGASDAKISGDGSRVAYIRDNNAQASTQRDLILQDRAGSTTRVLAGNVTNLAVTYGRAISDDGLRVVYSADIAANSSQVFLFDGRTTNSVRQITALGVRDTDVPLHPTISGDGTRLAFATRRPVANAGTNSDNSIELYTFDIPTGQFGRVTDAASTADGFSGSTRLAEVVSSLSDDGSVIAFNFPRRLSGVVTAGTENNSEIYATGTAARPTTGSLTVVNEASFGKEPATPKAVAPDSRAAALGGALAFTTQQVPKPQDGTSYPTTFGGTTVTVNNRPAKIFFISPTQVNFLVPPQTELGTATVVVTNVEGFQSRGTVQVLNAAPGIFTSSKDGEGEAVVLNADTGTAGPFDPSGGNLRLVIFTTGVRRATQVSATAGGRALVVESYLPSPDMPGMDEVRVLVPSDLRGAGPLPLVVRADARDSNTATIIFSGNSCIGIAINEVLADPPDGPGGDANRDGTRSTSDDEFIELVNTTGSDRDISGYQLLTRSTSASSDTVRYTFAPGTIFPAGSAIVVFGGGTPTLNDPAFGGAQIFTASPGGLSLTNTGGIVTLRQPSQAIVNIFSYGGSTGLNGDNNQSLTRFPDADASGQCGAFRLHTTVPTSEPRVFSPGTRVDGTPFQTSPISRIDVSPPNASISVGAHQQFTATAYGPNNEVYTGVIFTWQSSNTSVATIDQNGFATGVSAGMTEIRASARGAQSAPATLTVVEVQRVLTSITVTPSPATIPVTGQQQFTAKGFDQFGNEITGLTFTWESTNTSIATVDQTGLATGIAQGQTTIKATSGGVSGTATLNVTPPTVVINEVLADPPGDATGDANHDGAASTSDDEFVELVNSTGGGINISGWTVRTRSATTETVRHTFAANTTLPAGEAFVVFGGGTINAANGAFACAQVVKASSGGLSLTNTGLTVVIRDAADNLIAQFTYGGSTGLNGGNDQSLTRSPDITGNFVQHTAATGAGPRRFSPGTKVDGTPFGSCPARLTSVTISPSSASVITNQSTQFTAQAFDQFGQPIKTASITFASDNTSVATVDSVTTDPATGIATATVTGRTPGTAHITAQSTEGATTVTSTQATLTVNDPAITYSVSGQVKDAGNNPISGVLVTFDMNFQGILSSKSVLTDANGNYSSGDLGCQNTVKVTPSKTGLVFTPSATSFVNPSQCLSGSDTANFTASVPPPGTLVISQLYVGGGNSGATYANDYVEIFNSGTTTVDFSVTPYSIQYVGTTGAFGSTSAGNKTNITTGTIAPGQYFLVQEASGGAIGAALPTPDATGSINMAAAGGKVALVVGTTALPAATCPGDDATSPFNPTTSTIADFVGYGSSSTTTGHCYEGPGPAAAPASTNADFRKAGGCVDTNFNTDDFLVAGANPRNTASALNNCSAGLKPEITINDPASVSEASANVSFTVTLSTAGTLPVTVDYSTANGTATAGADYTAVSGTLTFNPGETVKNIIVPIINDTMDEPSETFFVNLSNASNSVILDSQGQGTITDNDNPPSLSINDVSVAEGDTGTTNATFTVTLSAASSFTVTVNFATADGTATVGSDYQSTSGTLTFNPGETTKTIPVPVNGDMTFEADETFVVNLSTPANATISDTQGQGTITNDDAAPPLPAITIDDVTVTEGNSGTKTATFTVSLSISPTSIVTVDYATANGTATAGSDYQATTGTLTFNPGETTKTIGVTINGDTVVEANETFFVNLTNAVNAFISDGQGLGTIQNDDTANLVISQVYGGGNNTGAPYQRDFIELFNRGTTTIDFSVTPYSVQYASAGAAFVNTKTDLTSGTVAPGHYFLIQEAGGTTNGVALPTPDATGTIAMGNTSGKVALVVGTALIPSAICPGDDGTPPFNPSDGTIADFIGYGSVVCYEGSGPAPAPDNTTADFRRAGGCTDTDNNASDFFTHTPAPRNSASPVNDCSVSTTPNLTISDASLTEGNSGTVTATFTVQLSAPASGSDVTFDIATQNNTATSGSDYVAKSLTNQIIPAGSQTLTFSVTVNGDTAVENDETFFVNVTNVAGANVTDGQGLGTIQNDDLPTLSINDVTLAEGNSGATTFTFTVSLSALAPANVTFDIATQDNTATIADNDYVARTLTSRTIPAGQQTYTFDVTVNGDTAIEPTETFLVNVTNISGATALDSQGLGTIQNDDSPTLSINDVSLNEGNAGTTTFSFNVHLSQPAPAGGVTFDISTADGTAQDDTPPTEDNDYVAKILTTQTIPGGSQDYTFDVTVNGDKVVEPNETFFVNLTNAVGATILDGQGQGTIQNDDAADLVISQVYGGGGNGSAPYTNDFVEIFNHGTTTVNFAITPYSIQYAGAGSNFPTTPTGSALTIINSGTIAPGGYFLVQEASGGAIGVALPTPDASGSIDLAATAGKVALVAGTAGVSPNACPGDDLSTVLTNPSGNNIVDFVGYGTTASCYEGTGRAPAPSNTTADFRRAGGCTETNDNAADFLVATPRPRNTSSPTNNCVAGTAPDLTISDATVVEGNSGTTTATFTVSLSSPAPSTDVTFNIATQNNTATSGSDYTSKTSTAQVIPAGAQTYTFTVNVTGDTAIENDETFFVNVTSVTGANAVDTQGVGTIQNDDFPALSISDVSLNEGNAGTTTFAFTVQLSAAAPTGGVTFDIATADGTAQDGTPAGEDTDYVARSLTTQTISAGSQTYTFNVTVNGDTAIEPDETFLVNVSNVTGATVSDGQGQGTIQNDDSPKLSITDVTLNEGNAGTTPFTFTVTLTPSSTQTVTVNYATADGTASATTAPIDYTAVPSTQLTFTPGETSKQVTILVNGDTLSEANETFFVNLSGATNATITKSQGIGTINNDDAAATSADLSVTKSDSPDPVLPGNNVTYTLNIANGGPDTASSVTVTDNLPSSVTFVSCSSTNGGSCSNTGNNVTVSFPSLANGATAVITLVASVNSGTGGTTITNTATIAPTATDPQTSNNTATTTTNVARTPTADELIINEVLADPNSDANRDGTGAGDQRDEFVEIINSTNVALNLSGLNLYDSTSTTPKHTFPANTLLQPGKAIVIFGGETGSAAASNIPGIPAGTSSKTTTAPNASFGGAIVQVASSFTFTNTTSALGLNNTGSPADSVRIFNGTAASGTLLASATFPAPTSDKSFSRADGDPPLPPNRNFVAGDLHPQVNNASSPYNGRFYSPGFKKDGLTPF